MLKAEQIKTVLKMIRYHVSSYFLRQLTFSKATIRKDVLFLLVVTFIRPADFAGYEFGNPKR